MIVQQSLLVLCSETCAAVKPVLLPVSGVVFGDCVVPGMLLVVDGLEFLLITKKPATTASNRIDTMITIFFMQTSIAFVTIDGVLQMN